MITTQTNFRDLTWKRTKKGVMRNKTKQNTHTNTQNKKKDKEEEKAAVSLSPKGSAGWMSHRPQSVNEPADPCNKLLGRTAELEICRHSQNKTRKKKQKKKEREEEGQQGVMGGGLKRKKL